MKAIVIRKARPADIAAIVAIAGASPSASHWPESHYENALLKTGHLILVAEVQPSEVVGFLLASTTIAEWELENIAVSSGARRSGVGRALMTALIDHARRGKATEIRQEIRESNMAAQRLGLSVGFAQQGRRSDYYRNPVEDALLFKHLLGGGR